MAGPCTPWTTADAAHALEDGANLDAVILDEMVDVASSVLYKLSGRQFPGVCQDVVRPCSRNRWPAYPSDWRWVSTWGECDCTASARCGCGSLPSITLGAFPVREITQVLIDGAVLSSAAYRIDDRRDLVRIDGAGWPCCQNLALPSSDVGTFQVSFEWGQAPDPDGVLAAKVFAIELTKCVTGKATRLPARVQNVAHEGLSFALLDPQNFLDNGRTGVYLVDVFLAATNPNRLTRSASVYSPDFPRPVTRTATTPGS